MLYKTTTSLFRGKYQYKIVLVCSGVSLFRDGVETALNKINNAVKAESPKWHSSPFKITGSECTYLTEVHKILSKAKDYDYRIENPWMSIYTNSKSDIEKLAKLDNEKVKYITEPAADAKLEAGCIVMKNKDFEYRITLGKTTSNHTSFVEWAEVNKNFELTKSCKKDLRRDKSWGGTYFYVNGERNITLAKVHLGGSINKIERIIKG
jgi:hypothetical protein